MSDSPRLVVRAHAPGRRLLVTVLAAIVLVGSAWGAFEWGRARAGFDGSAARAARALLSDRIRELEEESRTQRLKLAMMETNRAGQSRERSELSRTIGDLQAEVARLTSDLAFYRGVVADRGSGEVLKIQQFRVTRGAKEREYRVRLVLGRPLRPEDAVSGRARLTFEGTGRDGAPQNLDLAAVAPVEGGELPFDYRYTTTLEQLVQLPAGFTPLRTTVELTVARKGVNPVRETFLWTVENP
jgi:hypothetical protein